MTHFGRHIRMTASEIAMGRYMRAPDHPADDAFSAAFDQFGKDEGGAGAPAEAGGNGDDGGAAAAAAGGPAGADAGGGDGGAAAAAGAEAGGEGGDAAAAEAAAAAAAAEGGEGDADAAAAAAAEAAAGADDKGGKAAAPAAAAEDDDAILKRLAAAVKKVDEPAAVAAPVEEEEAPPLLSAEETAKIEHFRKEWPEVAEAFDLQSRALAHSVIGHVFKQIGAEFIPIRDMVNAMATRTHYADIKEKVGEYSNDEVDAVNEWVDQQPTYLQAAMKAVLTQGTADEVADLVGRYRKETGKQPAGEQAAAPGPSGGEPELSGKAKQAASALAPVSSKRSAVAKQEDPTDFDGSFARFADELG